MRSAAPHPRATTSRCPITLGVAVLASTGLLLAGCGGSSPNGGVAHLATEGSSSVTTGEGAASSSSDSPQTAAIAFAKCMRSSGEPNFPDPKATGGSLFHQGASVNPSSRAFEAAQAKCKKLLPPSPGSGPPPSAQTLAHWLKVAQCMRSHGVTDFPDPQTKAPSNLHPPTGASRFVISDIEGVILVMGSIDEQSPLFTRAAAACAFPLHNH